MRGDASSRAVLRGGSAGGAVFALGAARSAADRTLHDAPAGVLIPRCTFLVGARCTELSFERGGVPFALPCGMARVALSCCSWLSLVWQQQGCAAVVPANDTPSSVRCPVWCCCRAALGLLLTQDQRVAPSRCSLFAPVGWCVRMPRVCTVGERCGPAELCVRVSRGVRVPCVSQSLLSPCAGQHCIVAAGSQGRTLGAHVCVGVEACAPHGLLCCRVHVRA
jgi:hypothetical protein